VEAGRASGEHAPGRRRLPVADEQDEGGLGRHSFYFLGGTTQ
jgi:hypothetical protein